MGKNGALSFVFRNELYVSNFYLFMLLQYFLLKIKLHLSHKSSVYLHSDMKLHSKEGDYQGSEHRTVLII